MFLAILLLVVLPVQAADLFVDDFSRFGGSSEARPCSTGRFVRESSC